MIDLEKLTKKELIEFLLQTKSKQDAVIEKQDSAIKKQDSTIKKQDRAIKKQDTKIKKQNKIINKLEAANRDLHIKIEELIAKYEDKLLASSKSRVEQFIPSSEKLEDKDRVFNELEKIDEKKTRKAPTQRFIDDLKELASKEIIIDYDFEDVDESSVKGFGEDISYKLEYKPATYEVLKITRKKYKDKNHIYETISDDPFPRSPLTASLAANVLTMKFDLGVPFYRYSKYLKANGLNISDVDICNYAGRTMNLIEPLYDKLLDSLVNNSVKVLHIDETPLKVIKKCYMFVYATTFWDYPIYIYDFNDSRKTNKLQDLLKDYKGYCTVDGYAGYNALTQYGIKIQRCMVHARRYFYDVLKVLPENMHKTSCAFTVIELMAKLFHDESEFRRRKLTADEIKKERNSKRYRRYIKELDDYINGIDTTNNELLSKAVKYYNNQYDELYTYLEDGHVDLNNSLAERVVKPFVIARKNFLFCKTADGATISGKIFSIVQTAKANGLKSEQYLAYVINNINKKDINDLLPWSQKLPRELSILKKQ